MAKSATESEFLNGNKRTIGAVMFNYDLHSHTVFSGHAPAEQTVAAVLVQADSVGIETIAITEHIFQPEHLKLIEQIRRQVNQSRHKCRVIVGAEINADNKSFEGQLVLDQRCGLDYIIGSIHWLPGTDILPHCHLERPLSDAEAFDRWSSTILGLAANPLIDTLGHPGAMIANALSSDDWTAEVLEVFAEAAKISAEHNVCWELNNFTAGKLTELQRRGYHKVLQSAVDAGVELVYGSDAHVLADIGRVQFVSQVLEKLHGAESIYKPSILKRFN